MYGQPNLMDKFTELEMNIYDSQKIRDEPEYYRFSEKCWRYVYSGTFLNYTNVEFIPYCINDEGKEYKLYGKTFSFAFKPQNLSYSLVHQLHKSNEIDKKVFAFDLTNKDEGKVYLGGVPIDLVYGRTFGECDVVGGDWSCQIEEVVFEDVYLNKEIFNYTQKSSILFVNAHYIMYAPRNFYEFMREKVFKELINRGICNVTQAFVDEQINCNFGNINKNLFPSFITFVFSNGFRIRVHNSVLFTNETFIIRKNLIFQQDSWVFGRVFLKLFIMEFDYDKKTIRFHPNSIKATIVHQNPTKTPKDNSQYLILLQILMISCFLLWIILFLVIKIKDIHK